MHPHRRVDRWHRQARKGFLLIEALVASVILASILGSAWDELVRARKVSQDASLRMDAARVAQDRLEILRNSTYSNLTVGNSTFTANSLGSYPSALAATVTIAESTEVIGTVSYRIKKVDVVVRRGSIVIFDLSTLRSPS